MLALLYCSYCFLCRCEVLTFSVKRKTYTKEPPNSDENTQSSFLLHNRCNFNMVALPSSSVSTVEDVYSLLPQNMVHNVHKCLAQYTYKHYIKLKRKHFQSCILFDFYRFENCAKHRQILLIGINFCFLLLSINVETWFRSFSLNIYLNQNEKNNKERRKNKTPRKKMAEKIRMSAKYSYRIIVNACQPSLNNCEKR